MARFAGFAPNLSVGFTALIDLARTRREDSSGAADTRVMPGSQDPRIDVTERTVAEAYQIGGPLLALIARVQAAEARRRTENCWTTLDPR